MIGLHCYRVVLHGSCLLWLVGRVVVVPCSVNWAAVPPIFLFRWCHLCMATRLIATGRVLYSRYSIVVYPFSNSTVQARHGTITCVTGLRGTCPTDSGGGRGR